MAGNKWLPVALVAGVCLGSLTLNQNAIAATINPVSPTVVAGNPVTLSLIDTIAQGSGIGASDLQITFDPKFLSLTAVVNGSLLTSAGWDPASFNPATGLVSIAENGNSDDPQGTGSFILVTFTALASDKTGSTAVSIQSTSGANSTPYEYHLAQISDTINITAAAVTPPTTVPEPGTVALLLVPVLAAASLKRRARY